MTTEKITSRKNEIVRHAVRLRDDPEFRRSEGLFLSEGARLCSDAAESGIKIETLFFTESAEKKYASYLKTLVGAAQRVCLIEESVAELLGDTKNTQGVFSVGELPNRNDGPAPLKRNGKYIALQRLQDPGNLGAVLRTAEALGISGAVLTDDCCDPFGPKALRSGMGACFRLPLFFMGEAVTAADALNRQNLLTLAAVPDKTAISVTQLDFTNGAVVFIGNEGNGLTEPVIRSCKEKVTIPMKGRAESLNAASSAAILMWEMMR